ncbi:MAG: hypothetical protein ABSC64_22185 [Candidatus Korobacteraceae bacterium]|jgi:hypothetical protein
MANPFDPKKWCRIPKAYEHLNGAIPEMTIRKWAAQRKIASLRIGGTVFVSIDGLDSMVKVTPAEVANG